jgi:ADP-heptose:LPS heptosyltransferase
MKIIKYFFAVVTYWVIEFISKWLIRKRKTFDLLILRIDKIGDYLIWLDALAEIKQHFSDKKVLLVCQKQILEFVQNDPFFTEIMVVDDRKYYKKPLYMLKIAMQLACYNFDTAINTHNYRSITTDSLIKISKSKHKIGFKLVGRDKELKALKHYNKYYSKLIHTDNSRTVLEQNEDLIKQSLNENFEMQLPELNWKQDSEFSLQSKKYVVFFTGASDLRRAWPVTNFMDLSKRISADSDIVLVGNGKVEKKQNALIYSNVSQRRTITDLTDQISLTQLCLIVKHAAFVVANDSMGVHLAVALKVKSFCIAGGGHWNLCVPYPDHFSGLPEYPDVVNVYSPCYRCDWECSKPLLNESFECVGSISVEQVTSQISKWNVNHII